MFLPCCTACIRPDTGSSFKADKAATPDVDIVISGPLLQHPETFLLVPLYKCYRLFRSSSIASNRFHNRNRMSALVKSHSKLHFYSLLWPLLRLRKPLSSEVKWYRGLNKFIVLLFDRQYLFYLAFTVFDKAVLRT